MKAEDTVEYNSLRWVKKELDLILQEAQASLSAYIEDAQDEARLRESIDHLHMVQGTLQMVELYGAAQLAEEMEKVSEALLNGKIDKVNDAYDVLMRSMLQLPDYLESLQSGSKDVPMVLLPLLNDLRASRNASLLSENVLFFPDVETSKEAAEPQEFTGELLPLAKKLRPHYQIGLVGWFKGQKTTASLKRILAVLGELEKKSSSASVQRIWAISSALVEGLINEGIDSNVSIKMLMGQVDRSIKQLVDSDEESFSERVPDDLLKNLLYYVARVKTDSDRVNNIKATYRLEELLPADSELEEVRSGMGGLNSELLATVSSGIREDLLEVKDTLEIYVHSEIHDINKLTNLPTLLSKIGDTLSMLGLGVPREQVMQQQDIINQLISGKMESSDELIMDIAGVLLSVESQLNSFIANRTIAGEKTGATRPLGDLGEMPESEYNEVLSAVVREALQDFSDGRQAILGYLDNPADKSLLEMLLKKLDEVNGAMFMLPVQKLKHQIDSVRNYVQTVMLNANVIPEEKDQNDLADVVTSVEYYLEALLEGRPDIEASMGSGDAAADRLNLVAEKQGVNEQQAEGETPEVLTESVVDEGEIELSDDSDTDIPEVPSIEEVITTEPESELVDAGEERYVILGDDADEEILEIFIEEALEELASLNEQLPLWERDHGNEEALITIRRSFHTLKGSGRLIGAELIGEFSWNFENMLNRVIDKSRPLTQEVFEILNEALAVLPQLIEQLKGNREPIPNIYDLIDRADALGKWQKADDAEKTGKLETKAKVEEAEAQVEEADLEIVSFEEAATEEGSVGIRVDEDSLDLTDVIETDEEEKVITSEVVTDEVESFDFSEDEMMTDISEEELVLGIGDEILDVTSEEADSGVPSLELVDESEEEFDIDLTQELEALQVASEDGDIDLDDLGSLSDEVADISLDELNDDVKQSSEEESSQIYIDPVLFNIFKSESESHIADVKALLEKHHQGAEPLTSSAGLLRALHTLFGSARTAEVDEIAELCGGLEKYVRLYLTRDQQNISENGVQLVESVIDKVSSMLEQLEDQNQRLQSDRELLNLIQQNVEEVQLEIDAEEASDSQAEVIEDVVIAFEEEEPEPVQPVAEVTESLVSYSDVDDELVDIFLEEAEELLDSCENSLQRWNSNNDDSDSVQDLQRHLHTLKGGARMADLGAVGDLTHALESLIISVNDGQLQFSKDMSKVLHESLDQLSDMLNKVKDRQPLATAEKLITHIDAIREGRKAPGNTGGTVKDEEEEPEPAIKKQTAATIDDDFDVVLTEESLLDEDYVVEMPDGFELSFDEGSDDQVAEIAAHLDDELLDDSIFEVEIEPESIADSSADEVTAVKVKRLEESLTENDELETEVVAESASENVELSDSASALTLNKESTPKEPASTAPAKDSIANEQVRVRSDLLNDLVNHAGEVSVYHARMGQQISNFSFNLSEMEHTVVRLREQLRKLSIETEAQILSRYEKEADQYDKDFDPLEMDRFSTMQQISRSLQETVGDIDSIKDLLYEEIRDAETLLLQESRVSNELQEGLMRTRMVHFGGLASRLRRIVRQTARELDKDVELDIIGETAEVDRTVLDRIVAPLEHMLRNAVSHGIEQPTERKEKGKAESGKLTISVDREGGDVVIIVKDDGRGIDVNAIRKKAVEKGMLEADSEVSDHDVLQYIMEPGFSTAKEVTQISGRGVGMDVVDSEIKQLGGVLEIDTVQGKGTTFKVRLPLTLAINHALLVAVSEELYAVPLNSIEGVVRLSGIELQRFYDSGDDHYEFAGSSYRLKHLGNILTGVQQDYSHAGQLFPVLLARVGDQSVALHVDELIGRREIVVKPVGAQLSSVRGVSGATILGDGRVVIILEMNALVLGDSLFHVDREAEEVETVAEAPVEDLQRETVVMVVDDSITIRKVTERMLSRHNMKVITAKDGLDAVSQLQEVKPDVMLLDIEMPRMDGYEVASHVRNDERLKDLPIIMITSRSGSKHRDKAMEIGVNKYLGKPYQEDDLMENINELLN